jgi:hypothetical protein
MQAKPFQFSMRGMFSLIALLCVAAWFATFAPTVEPFSGRGILATAVFGAMIGWAISLITGAPIAVALCSMVVALAVLVVIWANAQMPTSGH